LTLSAFGFTDANERVILLASLAHITAGISDSTISEKNDFLSFAFEIYLSFS
jgi:hypothetical protein